MPVGSHHSDVAFAVAGQYGFAWVTESIAIARVDERDLWRDCADEIGRG